MTLPLVLGNLSFIGEIRHIGWEKVAIKRSIGSTNLYILNT